MGEYCVVCGEQEAIHDGMCADCLAVGQDRYDTIMAENNPGYRECECEDYPCCGH